MWIYLLDVFTFDFYLGFIFLSSVCNLQPLKKINFVILFKIFLSLALLDLSCSVWDIAAHELSSYGTWTPELTVSVVAALRLLGLFVPGVWDFSSPDRDQTHVPFISRQIPSHWTTKEVPISSWSELHTSDFHLRL